MGKGRNFIPDNSGIKAGWAILDWVKVSDIRTKRLTQESFAALYGVSRRAVRNVQLGLSWKEPR